VIPKSAPPQGADFPPRKSGDRSPASLRRLESLRAGERALLVVGFFCAGADAGRDELDSCRKNFSQRRDFQRRTDQPAQTGFHRQRRKSFDLFADIRLAADFRERICVRTGQHGDAEHERRDQAQ